MEDTHIIEPEIADYDGLIEVSEELITEHQEVFQWKEKEGKIYFKFKYSPRNKYNERVCCLIKHDSTSTTSASIEPCVLVSDCGTTS